MCRCEENAKSGNLKENWNEFNNYSYNIKFYLSTAYIIFYTKLWTA